MEALARALLADPGPTAQALRCAALIALTAWALRHADEGADAFERHYGPRLRVRAFVLNLLLFPLLALGLMTLGFAALLPGFGSELASNPAARPLILRQLALEGLLPGVVVNFFAVWAAQGLRARGARTGTVLAADAGLRLALFVPLLAMIYVAASQRLGSFAGDAETALGVVGPTLAAALRMEAGTGLSLYAVLLGALPLWVAALAAWPRAAPALRAARRVPGLGAGPGRAAAGLIGAALALFSTLAILI